MAAFARLLAPRALRCAATAASLGLACGSGLASTDASSSSVALSPAEFRPFRLLAREQLTPDTSRFSFALPSESAELGVPVAACLTVRVPDPADPISALAFAPAPLFRVTAPCPLIATAALNPLTAPIAAIAP